MYLNTILCKPALEFLKENVLNWSVDLTVTSPPYDNLRNYGYNTPCVDSVLIAEIYRVTKTEV